MKSTRSSLRFFIFAVVAVCLTSAGRALAIGFQPVSPDELKMTAEPQAPGAPAVILYRQVDRDDSGNAAHEDNYYRVKILTEEGRKYADIEIPFNKGDEDVVNIHARTIRPDGGIVNFDGKVFEKPVVKGRGIKFLAKTFTLPDVQPGGIIEYFYTYDLQEHYVFDSHWILSDELFTKRARFSLRPYTSQYVQIQLRFSWQGLKAGVTPKQDPDHIVRMEATDIPAFVEEDFMPPPNELKARVDFIYDEENTEREEGRYWQHVGKQRYGRLDDFIGKHKAMEEAVRQITAPGDAPEMKLRKIYDRVQQLRNTSYEEEKTEQESKRAKEKRDENVEDVWRRGYGSGDQLTWLFLAMAKAAGFEAYGCWVSNRRNYFFTPKTMQSDKLDSNVVLVKVDGKERYFDPGAKFTPFGMLPWPETKAIGLKLDKDGGTWMQTDLPFPSDSRIERKGKLKLSETGDLEGKLTVTYVGLEALYRRLEERHADTVGRKKFLEDEAAGLIPAAAELELTNQPDWASAEEPLVSEFDLKIPGWASGAGKRALFPVGVFSAGERTMFEHANRVQPVYFEYPFEEVDDISVELPTGWAVESIPAAINQDGHVVSYISKAENEKGSLHLERKISLDILLMDAKYYPALRNFFGGVRNGDEAQIVLQPHAARASN